MLIYLFFYLFIVVVVQPQRRQKKTILYQKVFDFQPVLTAPVLLNYLLLFSICMLSIPVNTLKGHSSHFKCSFMEKLRKIISYLLEANNNNTH